MTRTIRSLLPTSTFPRLTGALVLALAATTISATAQAANHYVRPGATGAHNGGNWNDAWTSLPAKLVRGDTYYLAGGNYGEHMFQDAASGTTPITVVRATVTNHGTATGWDASYANGTAVFQRWQIFGDYYVFDGQRRNPDWQRGTTSNYGIRVSSSGPVRLDDGISLTSNHVTFRYIDFHGSGRDSGEGDDVIYGLLPHSNMTFEYCALHDSDRTIFLMRGDWRNLVVDHSYIARNRSTDAVHGEMMSMTGGTHITISNNVMEDIEGSAFIAGVNGGTMNDWRIFGNVVQHTAAYMNTNLTRPPHTYGVSGFVYIAIGNGYAATANNFQVYNNTFYGVVGTWSGVVIQTGSNNVNRNNIWYASVRTGGTLGDNPTISNNWYYGTLQDGDSSPSKVVCTSKCSIFVDPTTSDFHLVRSLAPGYKLGAPFSVDLDGVTRGIDGTFDRGAYQYAGDVLSDVTRPRYVTTE